MKKEKQPEIRADVTVNDLGSVPAHWSAGWVLSQLWRRAMFMSVTRGHFP